MITELLLCAGALASGTFLSAMAIHYAHRRGLQDLPGHRSLHTTPTPRGGGIAIVIPALMASAIAGQWKLALCALAVAGIGWWDDHRSLDFRIRLLVQAVACAAFVIPGPALLSVTLFFGLLWMTNLYNFMDGIDGFASTEAVFCGLFGAFLCLLHRDPTGAGLFSVVAFSAMGLSFFGWQPARIFMGDVGSCFLGFYLSALAISESSLGNASDSFPIWSFLILMGAFIVDSTFTLGIRALRRQKVYQAHRDHAYQHAVLKGLSHSQVVVRAQLINLLWLAPLALLADRLPQYAPAILLVSYCPLIFLVARLRAGWSAPAWNR